VLDVDVNSRGWVFVVMAGIVWIPSGIALFGVGVSLYANLAEFPIVGTIICALGVIYLVGGVCVFVRRPWAYSIVSAAAVLFVGVVPIGTAIGLLALYGLKNNKHRFRSF
jgi:hypothetical protein